MAQFLDGPTPPKLKAITINGSIQVESEDDKKNREQKRKERRSRWDQTSSRNVKVSFVILKTEFVLLLTLLFFEIRKLQHHQS